MSPRSLHRWPSVIGMGIAYFVIASVAIKLTRFHGGVAFIWIANPVLLARLLTLRAQHWTPHVVICAVAGAIATALFGLGPAAALPMMPMNIAEAVIAAVMLRRIVEKNGRTGSYAPLPWFLLAAGVVAPAVSGLGGALVATIYGADTFLNNWFNWYAGHALGAITFTPIAVYLLRGDAWAWVSGARPKRALEACGHAGLVVLVSVVVFAQDAMPLLFLPMLPIILTTFRMGRIAAALAVVAVTLIGGYLTITGHGPIGLMRGGLDARIQFLQFYLACTVVTILPVSAELARRASLYRRLHESEARYRLLTENSTDIVLNLDVNGRIRFASPSIHQIGGYEPADVIGRQASELIDAEDVAQVTQAHLDALADPSRTIIVEYRARTAAGEMRWFETHTRAVLDAMGRVTGVVSAVRDVGHRKTVEQQLSHAAMTDRLTGIANRRAFDAQLDLAIQRAGGDGYGCVALFDLDRFKAVNDGFGHAAGDAVLRAFADLARGRMREMDLVARFGGEEFAVILPNATPEQARLVCDRLRTALAEHVVIVGTARIRVTVSGGVARYDGATLPEQVVAAADAALYEAKRTGRDRMSLAA